MKTKTKEVYYCDHCKKHGLSKHKMIWHELHCTKSPINQHVCYGCRHLTAHDNETYTSFREGGGDIYESEIRIPLYFTCGKLNKTVFTIQALAKRLPETYPRHFEGQELMPFGCDSFEERVEPKQLESDIFL